MRVDSRCCAHEEAGTQTHEFCVLGHLFFQDTPPQVSFAPKTWASGCPEQGCRVGSGISRQNPCFSRIAQAGGAGGHGRVEP